MYNGVRMCVHVHVLYKICYNKQLETKWILAKYLHETVYGGWMGCKFFLKIMSIHLI